MHAHRGFGPEGPTAYRAIERDHPSAVAQAKRATEGLAGLAGPSRIGDDLDYRDDGRTPGDADRRG